MTNVKAAARRPLPARPAALAAACAAAIVASSLRWPPHDPGSDLAGWLQQLPLVVVLAAVVVPVMTAAHYLLAGVAMRAATGAQLPLRTAVYAQLAAAAANRVVPNGVAGAGVNIRCLQRTGSSTAPAVAAMATLAAVGGLTDALWTALVATAGPIIGVSGARPALTALATHGVRAGGRVPWVVLGAVGAIAAVHVVRSKSLRLRPAVAGVRAALAQVMFQTRRPRQLAIMGLASMGTTAALSVGFAATVVAVGRGGVQPHIGSLLGVYLVGAAIEGATPLPALFGVTETALVAGLVVVHVPTTTAIVATLLFRGVAYWAPSPVGLLAARRLRAEHLL